MLGHLTLTLAAASPRFVLGFLAKQNVIRSFVLTIKLGQLYAPNKSEFGLFLEANELLSNLLLQTIASPLAVTWGSVCLMAATSAKRGMLAQWGADHRSQARQKREVNTRRQHSASIYLCMQNVKQANDIID